jgi:hypothetical protein
VRRFHLHRMKDETGKSGIGIVAEGLVFTDGTAVLRWMSATPSTLIFASQEQMEKIHGHDGKTTIIWKDE